MVQYNDDCSNSKKSEWTWNYEKIGLRYNSIKLVRQEIDNISVEIEKFRKNGGLVSKRKFLAYDYEMILSLYSEYETISNRIMECSLWIELEMLKNTESILIHEVGVYVDSLCEEIVQFFENFSQWIKNRSKFYRSSNKFFESHPKIDNVENRKILLVPKSKLSLTKNEIELLALLGDDTGIISFQLSTKFGELYTSILSERKFKKLTIIDSVTKKEESIICDDSNMMKLMNNESREIRKAALNLNNFPYVENARTYSILIHNIISDAVMLKEVHGFDDVLDVYINKLGFKVSQLKTIMKLLRKNLKPGHSFINNIADQHGLSTISNHDLKYFLPDQKINDVIFHMTHEQLIQGIKRALLPLGSTYAKVADEMTLPNYRLDIGESGDSSRACCPMCIESPTKGPVGFITTVDSWHGISNCAHEIGHMVNNELSRKNVCAADSYVNAIFGETVATLNELMIAGAPMKVFQGEKAGINEWKLNTNRIKWVMFYSITKQAILVEFELEMYKMVDEGIILTVDALTSTFTKIIKKYMGDRYEMIETEKYSWSSIEHYFGELRLYLSSYIIAAVLAFEIYKQIIESREGSLEKYISLLSMGAKVTITDVIKLFDISLKEATQAAIAVLD